MFVLGVDPGLSRCGYCVLSLGAAARAGRLGKAKAVAVGVLTTPVEMSTPTRLAILQRDVRELLDDYPPTAVAIERVLFQVNVSTAMSVGQASGIVMAEAAGRGCDVIEYSPNQVKEAVAGYGSADKKQVQEMVRALLQLDQIPKPDDAADALAIAITHLNTARYD